MGCRIWGVSSGQFDEGESLLKCHRTPKLSSIPAIAHDFVVDNMLDARPRKSVSANTQQITEKKRKSEFYYSLDYRKSKNPVGN